MVLGQPKQKAWDLAESYYSKKDWGHDLSVTAGREEIKLSLFADDIILYKEKPEVPSKRPF
jgi:hypothetical protein